MVDGGQRSCPSRHPVLRSSAWLRVRGTVAWALVGPAFSGLGSMSKPRPMPFWAEDWLSSTRVASMSYAAQGAFLRLLCFQWLDPAGTLPLDLRPLLPGRLRPDDRKSVEALFPPTACDAERRANRRLARSQTDDREYRERQRARGQKGNDSRWGGVAGAIPSAIAKPSPPSPSPSPSPINDAARESSPISAHHAATAAFGAWRKSTTGRAWNPSLSDYRATETAAEYLGQLPQAEWDGELTRALAAFGEDEWARAEGWPYKPWANDLGRWAGKETETERKKREDDEWLKKESWR